MENIFQDIIILIPALNPNESIVNIIKDLNTEGFYNIIVINDGSNDENKKYFEILKNQFNIKIYEHEKNLGKGQALKTGIQAILNENIVGVITVDADGQHLAQDVKKVALKLKEGNIVLGERNLIKEKSTPIASKIGNIFSSIYLKLLTGSYLKDTQTGLRGIPKKYFKMAIEVSGSRYDYEMNFLKEMCYKKIKFDIVEIETIYENRVKNFRIIRDSIIIYKEFFKNLVSSLIGAVADITLFWILFLNTQLVFFSNMIARIFSGVLDFFINRIWVYDKRENSEVLVEMYKYLLLFLIQMLLNSMIVYGLSLIFDKILIIKIIVNIILYLTNFFVKKRYIFV